MCATSISPLVLLLFPPPNCFYSSCSSTRTPHIVSPNMRSRWTKTDPFPFVNPFTVPRSSLFPEGYQSVLVPPPTNGDRIAFDCSRGFQIDRKGISSFSRPEPELSELWCNNSESRSFIWINLLKTYKQSSVGFSGWKPASKIRPRGFDEFKKENF